MKKKHVPEPSKVPVLGMNTETRGRMFVALALELRRLSSSGDVIAALPGTSSQWSGMLADGEPLPAPLRLHAGEWEIKVSFARRAARP